MYMVGKWNFKICFASRDGMVSAAMSELVHLSRRGGPRQGFGVEKGSRVGVFGPCEKRWCQRPWASPIATVYSRNGLKQPKHVEIAQSQDKECDSMWTLTQESWRDEAEIVRDNYYVGGSVPLTQNYAFHNLLTGMVCHWMGEDYWGDWKVDRKQECKSTDIDRFTHIQQPLLKRDVDKCSMITTEFRLSKTVTPFPVIEELWDKNTVITLADDQDRTLDVKLLEFLCFTCVRSKA